MIHILHWRNIRHGILLHITLSNITFHIIIFYNFRRRSRRFFRIILMRLHMLSQMIRPHESLTANTTRKSFFPSMRTKMSLQFIRPCKSLTTKQPITDKRSFTSMPPQMRLQMRRFPINLIATRIMADMELLRRRFLQSILLVDAVRALALDASPRLRGETGEIVGFDDALHGKRRHVGILRPLVLLLRQGLLRLIAAGRDISRGWGVLEQILVSVAVVMVRV